MRLLRIGTPTPLKSTTAKIVKSIQSPHISFLLHNPNGHDDGNRIHHDNSRNCRTNGCAIKEIIREKVPLQGRKHIVRLPARFYEQAKYQTDDPCRFFCDRKGISRCHGNKAHSEWYPRKQRTVDCSSTIGQSRVRQIVLKYGFTNAISNFVDFKILLIIVTFLAC